MKKVCLYLITIGIFISSTLSGQISNFDPPTDTLATINELYTHDFDATGNPDAPSYSFDKALDGMSINSTTGLLTWTPGSEADGGKVIVRATNTGFTETIEFYIYVSGPPDCDISTIAYWKLNETEGPVYKDSYGAHNASVSVNEPGDSAGVVGKCQKFTPWPFIEMTAPDHSDFDFGPDQSFSISFWFKTSEADYDSTGVIIGRNDGLGNTHWWVGVDWDKQLTFLVRDFSKPPDNFSRTRLTGMLLYDKPYSWHHAVAVYDADDDTPKIWIYFDGSSTNNSVNYNADNSPGLSAASPLCIGFLNRGLGDEYQFPFHGSIDEMIIFNKALTTAEIDTLYNRGTSSRPACDQGNAAPLFRSEPVTDAYEDAPYSYQFFADDINAGDVLTYSAEKKPAWLNVNLGTRTLSGTPDNNDVGSDSMVIKVNDGSVDIYQRFLLTVINTNDPPVITSTEVTAVNEEEPYSYDVDANDVDTGDNLTFSLQPPTPGWLSVNASSGLITGTPPIDDTTSYNVTVRVTDDSAAYDEQTYTLDIRNINDAPQVSGTVTPLDVDEDKSLLVELNDIDYTDSDNNAGELTFNVLNGTNYSVNANTITPDLNYSGALSVNIEISDPDSTTGAQIDVTVNPVNDPPIIITFPDEEAWAGQSYSYVFNATDIELDELTYSIPEKPGWLTWVEGIRTLSGTPGFSDIGIDTLTIRVSDGSDNTDSTFYITVNTENNIPHITSAPLTEISEDELYMYNITFEDADPGDVVTLSYIVKPGWLTLNVPGQTLSGVPTNDQVGIKTDSTYVVQLKVSDSKQDSTQTFQITVINTPDAPEILPQTGSVGAFIGIAKTIEMSDINIVDVDNLLSDLTLTILTGTGYSIAGNDITIEDTQEKSIGVNFRVTDPGDLQDEGVLNVTVLDNTGIEDLIESNSLVEKVYPVPASEYIRFVVNSLYDYTIEIIDITGKIVFEKQQSGNENLIEINTGNMETGLYIYKVYNKSVFQVGRITVSSK